MKLIIIIMLLGFHLVRQVAGKIPSKGKTLPLLNLSKHLVSFRFTLNVTVSLEMEMEMERSAFLWLVPFLFSNSVAKLLFRSLA